MRRRPVRGREFGSTRGGVASMRDERYLRGQRMRLRIDHGWRGGLYVIGCRVRSLGIDAGRARTLHERVSSISIQMNRRRSVLNLLHQTVVLTTCWNG